jgi:hypothetical protein
VKGKGKQPVRPKESKVFKSKEIVESGDSDEEPSGHSGPNYDKIFAVLGTFRAPDAVETFGLTPGQLGNLQNYLGDTLEKKDFLNRVLASPIQVNWHQKRVREPDGSDERSSSAASKRMRVGSDEENGRVGPSAIPSRPLTLDSLPSAEKQGVPKVLVAATQEGDEMEEG